MTKEILNTNLSVVNVLPLEMSIEHSDYAVLGNPDALTKFMPMNHSLPFRLSPCSSSLLKTHVKSSCQVQVLARQIKTAGTTPIIEVQRYLKGLSGQEFDNKELGGMRFGPNGLRGKIYDTQKGSFHIGKMVVIL